LFSLLGDKFHEQSFAVVTRQRQIKPRFEIIIGENCRVWQNLFKTVTALTNAVRPRFSVLWFVP
jgi:hypothetical protein